MNLRPLGYEDRGARFNTGRHLAFLSVTIRHIPSGCERDGAVARDRLRLLRGRDLDFRAQRSALVDRDRHADSGRYQPWIEVQER